MPKKFTNPDSETNIRRIDTRGTHGFQVHFDRQGTIHTKFFNDISCGGKEIARQEARKYREHLISQIPESAAGAPAWKGQARSNTGKMGVSISHETLGTGKKSLLVQVTVRARRGVSVNKKFRSTDGDVDNFIQKATDWRNDMLARRLTFENKQKIKCEDTTNQSLPLSIKNQKNI
jgi:hypothetical protein